MNVTKVHVEQIGKQILFMCNGGVAGDIQANTWHTMFRISGILPKSEIPFIVQVFVNNTTSYTLIAKLTTGGACQVYAPVEITSGAMLFFNFSYCIE